VADLWVYDFARGMPAADQASSSGPWTPDGTRIAYGLRVRGSEIEKIPSQISLTPADGPRRHDL
jgi:hypothetical protein